MKDYWGDRLLPGFMMLMQRERVAVAWACVESLASCPGVLSSVHVGLHAWTCGFRPAWAHILLWPCTGRLEGAESQSEELCISLGLLQLIFMRPAGSAPIRVSWFLQRQFCAVLCSQTPLCPSSNLNFMLCCCYMPYRSFSYPQPKACATGFLYSQPLALHLALQSLKLDSPRSSQLPELSNKVK